MASSREKLGREEFRIMWDATPPLFRFLVPPISFAELFTSRVDAPPCAQTLRRLRFPSFSFSSALGHVSYLFSAVRRTIRRRKRLETSTESQEARSMNAFRILGDLSRFFAISYLIFALHRRRATRSISFSTQLLYVVVCCSR